MGPRKGRRRRGCSSRDRKKDTGGSRDTHVIHGTHGRTRAHGSHGTGKKTPGERYSTGKKTPGEAGTHTGHTGTRIRQTNLTTIQTHQPTAVRRRGGRYMGGDGGTSHDLFDCELMTAARTPAPSAAPHRPRCQSTQEPRSLVNRAHKRHSAQKEHHVRSATPQSTTRRMLKKAILVEGFRRL